MNRLCYNLADVEDREAQISSRTSTLRKDGIIDLWISVIQRAINDLVICKTTEMDGFELNDELKMWKATAEGFLFDDKYTIPMDDYNIKIECSKCKEIKETLISIAAGHNFICPQCKHKSSWKYTKYSISEDQSVQEISLPEMLMLWDLEDIDGFRLGIKKLIEVLAKKKMEAAKTKERNMRQRKTKKKENEYKMSKTTTYGIVDTLTSDNANSFDKAIAIILSDTYDMLIDKNRKYGNSALNPVRVFSNADPLEQIKVRIDDKISRLVRGDVLGEDEDVVRDLIGYFVIYLVGEEKMLEEFGKQNG